jgi:radical SAM protein with 4Fe4S-binding SPASM domain
MDCPHVPVVGYGDFSARLRARVAGRRLPIAGSLEVTARCNLGCVHCYINRPADDRAARARELSRDELCALLDDVAAEGCLWLLLTGGEPLLRPDFPEVYRHAKGRGLLVTLFTNATLVTPAVADLLAEWPPFVVEVTLYGATAATYERVTGVPGSFARCLEGIARLRERRVPVTLKSMILTLNRHEVAAMKELAAGLGLEFRFETSLNLRLDGGREPARYRLSDDEAWGLDAVDPARRRDWRALQEELGGPPANPELLYQCGAGRTSFNVDPEGRLTLCALARTPAYELRQGSFRAGWHEFFPTLLGQRRTRASECQECELHALCEQCPGWAQLESGDPEQVVPHLCTIAKRRGRELDLGGQPGGER